MRYVVIAVAGTVLGCSDQPQRTPAARSPAAAPAPNTETPAAQNAGADLKWLDGYNGETVDELISLEGKYRTDSLVVAFGQAMDQKAARVGDGKLTEEERVILAIEALEREVNNGGYGQFFVNSSREYVPIIADALRSIGCPKTVEITQNALKIVQQTPMTDYEIENGTWEENKERQAALGECDSLYFERPENIEESLFAFIKLNRAHPSFRYCFALRLRQKLLGRVSQLVGRTKFAVNSISCEQQLLSRMENASD